MARRQPSPIEANTPHCSVAAKSTTHARSSRDSETSRPEDGSPARLEPSLAAKMSNATPNSSRRMVASDRAWSRSDGLRGPCGSFEDCIPVSQRTLAVDNIDEAMQSGGVEVGVTAERREVG